MSALMHGIAARRLSPILDALAHEVPVIALHGPRSVGKSTLLATFAASRGVPVLDLDDNAVRDAVLANPSLAVVRTPRCVWTNTSERPACSTRSRLASTRREPYPVRRS